MTNGILVVLLIVVFTAVLAVGQGLYWAYVGRQEQKLEALKRRLGQTGEEAIDEESLFRNEEADVAARALGGIGAHIQQLLTSSDSESTTTAFLARVIVAFGIGLVGGARQGRPQRRREQLFVRRMPTAMAARRRVGRVVVGHG